MRGISAERELSFGAAIVRFLEGINKYRRIRERTLSSLYLEGKRDKEKIFSGNCYAVLCCRCLQNFFESLAILLVYSASAMSKGRSSKSDILCR